MKTNSPNISVASNIWICAEDPLGKGNSVTAASHAMPGDLAFQLLIPHSDSRVVQRAILDGTITKKQAKEREFFRHFAPHNHHGSPRITGNA
jgi:hypothetical protein